MPQQASTDPPAFTGPLWLELRNARNWACGLLDVAVGFDVLQARFGGRTVAVLDRALFGAWLAQPGGQTFQTDDLEWSSVGDRLCVSISGAFFTIVADSTVNLRRAV